MPVSAAHHFSIPFEPGHMVPSGLLAPATRCLVSAEPLLAQGQAQAQCRLNTSPTHALSQGPLAGEHTAQLHHGWDSELSLCSFYLGALETQA